MADTPALGEGRTWSFVLSFYLSGIWEVEDFPERLQEALDADTGSIAGQVTRTYVRETDHGGVLLKIPLQVEARDEDQGRKMCKDVLFAAVKEARKAARWPGRETYGWTLGFEVT